ncbi:histidine kinase [Paenibacillus sp. HB172176]|uniref:sensor histidine kinase n=1 Tax=Paenibacillus sp. HB172176 TaxID=2493690 RepID=UPI001F104B83|nr:histidine kinase [Paenibacillus sp. HB172176]
MAYSIRSILIIGFLAVLLPMVVFMIFNHFYAREIVRDKVAETYRNTLDIFVEQTDTNLDEISNYLIKMSILDVDVGMLMSFPLNSDMYTLTKIRIDTKLKRDADVYSVIDSVFVYQADDIILGANTDYSTTMELVRTHMDERLKSSRQFNEWEIRFDQRMDGMFFLMNSVEVTKGLYIGAIIRIKDMNDLLTRQWSDGKIGYAGLLQRDGNQLKGLMSEERPPVLLKDSENQITNKPYITYKDQSTKESYLIMNRPSRIVNVAYQVMIPEDALLKELTFFRNVALFTPIGIFLVLSLYLFFIRRMLLKPLQELIIGMKKISLGMLEVRLKRGKTKEFTFLGEAFNKMAEQIKTLKIDVYEEQLRVKQGELRQLQAQINPHFYMNSLNIIYNLAALKDTDSVKKMSLHLADYFRFIMRINRDTILLGEELAHIENYMTIQKMRFPGLLVCEMNVDERCRSIALPALTLQPFVENAIIHGFKIRRRLFHIQINAERVENEGDHTYLKLVVKDNGAGFSAEVLSTLRQNVMAIQANSTSLGIVNVMDRLTLLYGDTCEIAFDNVMEEDGSASGARVTLFIPIEAEGDTPNV